eukprot:8938344-Alexandrium_andersonii.AAC.1
MCRASSGPHQTCACSRARCARHSPSARALSSGSLAGCGIGIGASVTLLGCAPMSLLSELASDEWLDGIIEASSQPEPADAGHKSCHIALPEQYVLRDKIAE